MSSYKEIDSGALRTLMAEDDLILVDVRTADEASRGIIQGARHIPLHLLPLQAEQLQGTAPLVFYCHSGMRSAQASAWMANQGRDNVFNLRGGVLAWGAAGNTLVPKN